MPSSSLERRRDHERDAAGSSNISRGKYPRLTTTSQSVSDNRLSLRGRPKTVSISWGKYQRASKCNKEHGVQDAKDSDCQFRVTRKPTAYRESSNESKLMETFSSAKEARKFIRNQIVLDHEKHPVLIQERYPKKRDCDQTCLRVVGPSWDVSLAACRNLDEAIDMENQPDAIEHSRRMFYSGLESLTDDSMSDDASTTYEGDDWAPRESATRHCPTGMFVDLASEPAKHDSVSKVSKRSNDEIGGFSPDTVAKRQRVCHDSPQSSIRDSSEALDDSIDEDEEAHEKRESPDSFATSVDVTENAFAVPVQVYVVKETTFESFKAKDERVIGLFTTLTDATKEVRTCWEVCEDRKYTNIEYLDGYHEDGRLWWTCRNEDGDGHDVDIGLIS